MLSVCIGHTGGNMSENHRILVVDDEASVRRVLSRIISREGWTVEETGDGAEALRMLARDRYDLVLLDLHMQPMDGIQVLEEIRRGAPDIVVIILTAHSSVENAVGALRLGAHDYLFKPATPETIRRRVGKGLRVREQALRRRRVLTQIEDLRTVLAELDSGANECATSKLGSRFLSSGRLLIDRAHRSATWGDQLLDLTTSEFDILICLVEGAPEPIAPVELANCALGYQVEEVEARKIVKWHIHQLRSKIEPESSPKYILTVRHRGYLWRGE